MTSKVKLSLDKSKDGTEIAVVIGGEYNKEKLYVHTGEVKGSTKKGVQELELGKHRLSKLAPKKQAEVMRVLQEAYARGIPPEHLQLNIPGAEDMYREMLGEVEEKSESKIKLPPGSTFELTPATDPEKRQVWYIAGASGSGKSYIAKTLAEKYQKLFPKRDVYLISKLKEDSTLDSMKSPPIRLNPEKIVEKPITDLEIFRESMVIFDDYDTFTGKEGKAVQQLIDDIAIQGRHQVITMCCLTHYLSNYKKTRLMLTEATHFVVYPQSTGSQALNYLLKTYLGIGPKEVSDLKKIGSRWLCIHKNFPIYYITETEAGLLNMD
jgi:hypothetical protein